MLYASLETDGTAFGDMAFLSCGKQECTPGYSFGPATRECCLIHYCLSGHGTYFVTGATHPIGPGDGFLIRPGELTFYQADEEDPWTYLWVNFQGSAADAYLARCGLDRDHLTFHCGYGGELLACVDEMLSHDAAGNDSEFFLQGCLYRFFGLLAKSANLPCPRGVVTGSEYVNQVVAYISAHFHEEITVAGMAAVVNLNRSYLTTLFQNTLHMSPQQFLTMFRMTRAKELLIHTGFSVAEIGRSCGYSNPLSFSKAFKKESSFTPSDYRAAKKLEFVGTQIRSADPHADDKRPV